MKVSRELRTAADSESAGLDVANIRVARARAEPALRPAGLLRSVQKACRNGILSDGTHDATPALSSLAAVVVNGLNIARGE